jgi:RHS repeat-associated protein
VVGITDANGTLTSQQRYLPFGEVRTDVSSPNVPATDYGYTGQRNLDNDIGLMDYKARFYSSYLMRFIQPDMLIPDATNPQAWNRFSYGLNNPISFNDPSGHDPLLIIGIIIGVAFLAGLATFAYINNPQAFSPPPTPISVATPSPTRTPTLNPTISSLLTATPTGTITPVAEHYLQQGPTSTPTPKPSPTAINPIDMINSAINDTAEPYAPSISDVMECAPQDKVCNFIYTLDRASNTFLLSVQAGKQLLSDHPLNDRNNQVCPVVSGANSCPYTTRTPTATSSPTRTSTPRTPTWTPTLPFRTPTSTATYAY